MDVSSKPARRAQRFAIAAATIVVFWICDSHDWVLYRAIATGGDGWTEIGERTALRYILPNLAPPLIVAALLFGPGKALTALGLTASPLKGFAVGFAATLLLAGVFAVTAPLQLTERINPAFAITAVRGAVLPGFFEEVFYRAFLFGFLFRFAGWGFLPAALIGAVIFGAGHLYQSTDPAEAAGIFAITAIGALWFAWLYVEWDYNLWVPVSIHLLMNFWWEFFDVADTALGPASASAARLAVILISIVLTVVVARGKGGRTITGRVWLRGTGS